MSITVDRSAKSTAAPAAAPPKSAVRPALPARGRSVGRNGSHSELSSHGRAPTQAAAGACLFSHTARRVGKRGFNRMTGSSRHVVTVGVAARRPDGTRVETRERAVRLCAARSPSAGSI